MSNKYLEKIAIAQDEADAGKTFGKSWAAGWAGHVGGIVAGGAGAALLASRYKGVGTAVRLAGTKVSKVKNAFNRTGVGQGLKKAFGGDIKKDIGAAATMQEKKRVRSIAKAGIGGAVIGGVVGEDAANYASIRSDVKRQHRELGQQKTASDNRYLSQILKITKESE